MKIAPLFLLLLIFAVNANAQTCKENIEASTPTANFDVHNDGTVTDKTTGLTWKRCAEGQTYQNNDCRGGAQSFTWQQALQLTQNATFAGFNDWRLPNVNELEAIVEDACLDPAINLQIFPSAPSDAFWSSSPDAYYSDDAWLVYFSSATCTSTLSLIVMPFV